jgi:hypothetical protein
MLAAVADELSDWEDEPVDEEAAAAQAAAQAAATAEADAKARELVDAVMEEAAAGFPNLPAVDGEEEDVAQLLLDLNAAAAHSDDASSDEDGMGDAEAGHDADHAARPAAGAAAVAAASGKGRKKRRRDRSGAKLADQDDWAPGRRSKRGRTKGRAPPVPGRPRGRPRSEVPPMPDPAAAAGLYAPQYAPHGFFMASLQQQMAQAEAGDSGSESEGSDMDEGLTAEQKADRQAQKLIQAMTAAFASGDHSSMAQFAHLYRRVARNPAAFSQTMAYVFQWGAQMGQNIAASGATNSMAAAFSSMAAGMGPAVAEAAAAAPRTGRQVAAGGLFRADLANNRAAGPAGSRQQQPQHPSAAGSGGSQAVLKYVELLQASGGSSSSVVSDEEDGEVQVHTTTAAPATGAPGAATATDGKQQDQPDAAAAAAEAAAAAVAALKASGQLPACKLPVMPPCVTAADPTSMKALMALPLDSDSSDSSSGSERESEDDSEIAAMAAQAPKAEFAPLVFRSSAGAGPAGLKASTAGGDSDDATTPSAGDNMECNEPQHMAGGLDAAAGGKEAAASGGQRYADGTKQQPPKAAAQRLPAAAGMDDLKQKGSSTLPHVPDAGLAGVAASMAVPAAAATGYMQPAGYVLMPGASYYGAPYFAGGVASQWQQMANLQALQQQQLYQQQQAYYYMPQQQQLLLQQQQQQHAAARAAVLQQQQQLLAQHAVHKVQGQAVPPPQLVLNLQQPAPQQHPGAGQLLSPASAARAAAAGKPAGHVMALNLAGPPTSSGPDSATAAAAAAAALAAPDRAAAPAAASLADAAAAAPALAAQDPQAPLAPQSAASAPTTAPVAPVEG